jgi:hypothetical protein
MKATAAQHGIVITDIRFRPHDISEHCACRKPKPGLLLQAAKDYRFGPIHLLDDRQCTERHRSRQERRLQSGLDQAKRFAGNR